MEKKKMDKSEAGERRIFACLRFPQLRLGKSVCFDDGFFHTDSPELQRAIGRSGEYGITIHDVTGALMAETPLTERKKVYLSSDPSLEMEHPVRFRDLGIGLGIFASEDPDHLWLVARSPLLREPLARTGGLREVPRRVLQIAAKLAEARDVLKAAGASASAA